MPWTVMIKRADGSSLGSVEDVKRRLEAALPGVVCYRDPSGLEKMAAVSFEFPDVLRQHLERQPAEIQADYETNEFSIRFYLGPHEQVQHVAAEIRGNGNPLPALAALCVPNGWIAQESGTREIDLHSETAAAWEEFRQYRDLGIQQTKSRDSK